MVLSGFYFLEEEWGKRLTSSSTIVGLVHQDDKWPYGRIVRVARAVKISVRVNYHPPIVTLTSWRAGRFQMLLTSA